MFPINANDPYIKENGKRSTIGAELGAGGGGGEPYVLPTATSERLGGVKIGSGINVTEDGTISTSGYSLPVATSEILGGVKIGSGINVTEDGTISVSGGGGTATKIYYKDFNSIEWDNVIQVAKFADNAASAGGIFIGCAPGNSGYPVNVNGYTAISAVAIDQYTGYQYGVLMEWSTANGYQISLALGRTSFNITDVRVRVFYVKNEDVTTIPS